MLVGERKVNDIIIFASDNTKGTEKEEENTSDQIRIDDGWPHQGNDSGDEEGGVTLDTCKNISASYQMDTRGKEEEQRLPIN